VDAVRSPSLRAFEMAVFPLKKKAKFQEQQQRASFIVIPEVKGLCLARLVNTTQALLRAAHYKSEVRHNFPAASLGNAPFNSEISCVRMCLTDKPFYAALLVKRLRRNLWLEFRNNIPYLF
jgi:hypothetical protein